MKLCLIFPFYPPNHQIGGIEDYSRILVEKFRKLNIDTYVITSSHYTGSDEKVFTVGSLDWGVKELFQSVKIINREKFDVLLMQYTPVSYGFGIIYKLLPLVTRFLPKRTFFITTFHTLVGGKWTSKLNAVLLTLFSHQLISTNEELTFLFKKYFFLFQYKLAQIPIGSNIARYEVNKSDVREKFARQFGIESASTWLSNFGFTIPNKGIENLFEALARLISERGEYHLLMISALREGDQPYRNELIELSKKLNIEKNIIWINESTSKDISELLTASDIFVVPYTDGICARRGTLMAGIVHHLPIVSTHAQVPTPYFQNNDNALLVDPNNPKQLAEAIARLNEDEALQVQLSENIAKVEKHFNWNDIAYKIIRLYGKNSKSLWERIRYALKIVLESVEHIGWWIVLRNHKTQPHNEDLKQIQPSKILCLQLNAIGDVLMCTSSLKSLRARFPKAQIDVLTLTGTKHLLVGNANITHFHTCRGQFWRGALFQREKFLDDLDKLKQLTANEYDLSIDFGKSYESAVISAYLKIPVRLGFARIVQRGLFKTDASRFYSVTVQSTRKHIVENNAELLNVLGCVKSTDFGDFHISDADQEDGERFLSKHRLPTRKYAVVHPGAKWPPKRWPAKHVAQLIDLLDTSLKLKTILVGASEDWRLLQDISQQSQATPIVSCGDLTLGSLGAVLKEAAVFIGNDSGISHLSASLGVKTIVTFGPTDPQTCLAQGERVVALREDMPCWPCTLYYRRYQCEMGDNLCLHKLQPEKVLKAVKQLCA